MTEKLRPCPFCGGAAHASLAAYASGATARALCDGCGAAVLGYGRGERGLRDAVKRWNRRAERTCRNVCEWNIDTFHFTCSECGAEIDGDDWGDSPVFVGDYHEQLRYCPNCGAKVVGE